MLGHGPPERRRGREGGGKKLRSEPWSLFLYRLAAHLNSADVPALAARLSVRQLRRWCAFYRLEPFGDEYRRTGRQTAILAQAAGAKVSEEFAEMFLPTYDPARPTQTEEEMMRELAKLKPLRKAGK